MNELLSVLTNQFSFKSLYPNKIGFAHGQSLAEYGLVVGLVAVVSIASLSVLGGTVKDTLDNMNQTLLGSGANNGGASGQIGTNPMAPVVPEIAGGSAIPSSPPVASPGGLESNGDAPQVETNNGTGAGETNNMPVLSENPGGTTLGSSQSDPPPSLPTPAGPTPEQQYQSFLANNPQTAQIVNQLSPQGQSLAQQALTSAGYLQGNTTTSGGSIQDLYRSLMSNPNLSTQDRQVLYSGISNIQVSSE